MTVRGGGVVVERSVGSMSVVEGDEVPEVFALPIV